MRMSKEVKALKVAANGDNLGDTKDEASSQEEQVEERMIGDKKTRGHEDTHCLSSQTCS